MTNKVKCTICHREKTGQHPVFCDECDKYRLIRISRQMKCLLEIGENYYPENYKKEIVAFLTNNPNSNAHQVWNAIGGLERMVVTELKNLITDGVVSYSLVTHTYCVERPEIMNK